MVDEARSTGNTLKGLLDAGQRFCMVEEKGGLSELPAETGGWQVALQRGWHPPRRLK